MEIAEQMAEPGGQHSRVAESRGRELHRLGYRTSDEAVHAMAANGPTTSARLRKGWLLSDPVRRPILATPPRVRAACSRPAAEA